MKRIGFAFLLWSTAALAQFEGVVESRNTTTDETGALQQFMMSMWIKDSMAKITNGATGSAPAVTMIYRTDLNVIWMVNDEEKTYFEVSQTQQAEESPGPVPPDEKPVVRKTGRSRKILGYACDQFLVKHSGAVTEIWGTKRLAGLATALAAALGQEQTVDGGSWTDVLTKRGVFPLLASTRIDGKIVESQEVTRIERLTLPPELFALPAGYKKQSVGDMLK